MVPDRTNSWIVGRDPAWVIDPGPADPAHVDAVVAPTARRGGVGGIAITHPLDFRVFTWR